MTRPLSPAAQAMLDAVADVEWSIDFTDLAATVADTQRAIAAAALRAAATALKPDDGQSHQVGGIISARLQLFAIANELDPRP